MPARCAACGTGIKLIQSRSRWCTACRSFSCERCHTDESCPVCGIFGSHKDHSSTVFVLLIMPLLLGVIFAGIYAPDLIEGHRLSTMPVTNVGSAGDGSVVRLEGVLVANGTIAIDSRRNDSHGHFRFDRAPVVLLDPRDGQCITLELREETLINVGSHPSGSGEPGETSYHANDSVVAVGTVYFNRTGARWLRTERLAPAGADFSDGGAEIALAISIALPVAGFLGAWAFWGRYTRANERSIASRGGAFKIKPLENYEAPPGATVVRNARIGVHSRHVIICIPLFLAVSALFVLAYLRFPGSPAFQMPIGLYLTIVPFVPLLWAVISFGVVRLAVQEVALDGSGMTARYRKGKAIGFRWTDIARVRRPMAREGSAPDREETLVLELANGQEASFGNLTTALTEAVEAAHRKNAPEKPGGEMDLVMQAFRDRLAREEDPEKKKIIQEIIEAGQASDAAAAPSPEPEGPPATAAADVLPAGTRPAPAGPETGIAPGLPPLRVFANRVAVRHARALRVVLFVMGVAVFLAFSVHQSSGRIGESLAMGMVALLAAVAGCAAAIAIWLGIWVGSRYFGLASSVTIGPRGFSVQYHLGKTSEFRWTDITDLLSSTDIDPVDDPAKAHLLMIYTKDGRTETLKGLARDNAERICSVYSSLSPGLGRALIRARSRGASEAEAARLFADLMVDGPEGLGKIPMKWR